MLGTRAQQLHPRPTRTRKPGEQGQQDIQKHILVARVLLDENLSCHGKKKLVVRTRPVGVGAADTRRHTCTRRTAKGGRKMATAQWKRDKGKIVGLCAIIYARLILHASPQAQQAGTHR